MLTSQHHHISLRQQYHLLRRDWDNYKTSVPHHRRSHSSAANFNAELLQISPKKLVFPQHTDQSGRWLLQTLDNTKTAEAPKSEPPLVSFDCCSSPSVPEAWNEYMDEGSNYSDNDGDDWEEKDRVRGEKQEEWNDRMRWFGIVMIVVVVSVFSFGFVFGVEDVGQLMTPT